MKNNLYLLGCILATLFLGINAASAQFTVTGTIKDDTGEPLIGASVLVKGTTVGEITDLDGKFSLDVPTSPATLVFSFVGYTSKEMEVTDQTGSVDVTLSSDVTNLEEVVVTGLATSVKRSNLANAVSTVSGEDLVEKTGQATMDGALYGKLTGVNIVQTGGAPGGGVSVRLRGISSINGNNQPLYIIDGVYIDNSEIANGSRVASGANNASEENSANRIADLDPSDIENIEVLKGASAAAIYGSRANAGVIIITTKRGAGGKTKIEVGQDLGFNSIIKYQGMRDWNAAKIEEVFDKAEREKFEANGSKLYDYEEELYGEKGLISNTSVSANGGNDKTKFYIGAKMRNENGIVEGTGYDRNNFRANLDHKISNVFTITSSSNYVNTLSKRGFSGNENNGGLSYGYSMAYIRPWTDLHPDEDGNYPENPQYAGNVLQTRDITTNDDETNRFIQGLKLDANIFNNDRTNVKFVFNGGLDFYANKSFIYIPKVHHGMGTLKGFVSESNNKSLNLNYQALGVVKKYLNDGKIQLTTQGGISYLDFKREFVRSQATNLSSGMPPNPEQSIGQSIFSTTQIEKEFGYILQQDVNFNDQIIGSLGIRLDKSTLNGDENQLYAFPKASLAINVAKFDFWSIDKINQLKLRLAYGQTGSTARFGNAYTSMNTTNIGGNGGIIIDNIVGQKGNPNLKPEISSELEFGADFGMFSNRLGLELTYYIKSVKDLLLTRALPPSSGYTREVIQDASLENKGLEIALSANPVSTDNFNWTSRTNYWFNRSKLTQLGVPAFPQPGAGFGLGLGTFYIEEGASLTQLKGNDANGKPITIGDVTPDFQMSFMNQFTMMKNIDFSFLIHWKKGGENINLTRLLTDINQLTPDLDTEEGQKRLENPDGLPLNQLYLEDASYVRLRELALYYTITGDKLSSFANGTLKKIKVGISGRNLLTATKYSGYDPEVSANGGSGLSSGLDVGPFPSSKQMYFHLKVSL